MEQRLSLITLGVADLGRSTAFFEALGWHVAAPRLDSVSFFDLNGLILGLYPRDKLAEDAGLAPEEFRGRSDIAVAYNCRDRADVDQVLQAAVAAGGTLIKAAEEVFWGGYSGYFADPDDHLFEVAHNPFWTLDENGRIWMHPPVEA